jgi:7,8-dihydro-6-hydroxymethylpterin-pyrophosphokinase
MIHLNIGSNLESKFGNRFENISTALKLLIKSKVQINKVSRFL